AFAEDQRLPANARLFRHVVSRGTLCTHPSMALSYLESESAAYDCRTRGVVAFVVAIAHPASLDGGRSPADRQSCKRAVLLQPLFTCIGGLPPARLPHRR